MAHVIDLLQLSVLAALLVTTFAAHELGHWAAAQALGVWSPCVSIGWGNQYLVLFRTKYTQFRITTTFLSGGYTMLALKTFPPELAKEVAQRFGITVHPTRDLKPWEKGCILLGGVTVNFVVALLVSYGQLLASGHGALGAICETFRLAAEQILFVAKIPFGVGVPGLDGPIHFATAFIYMNIVMTVLNLLPVPPLDGFKLVEVAYEQLTGKEPSARYRKVVEWFLLIFMLSAVITALGILIRFFVLHHH